jgi:hypothetical protein
MSGSWTSFSVGGSSTETFTADVMILLTDGSVLVHNGFVTSVATANEWRRLSPDSAGNYETGGWTADLDMEFGRQWFASGVLPDGRVFVIGGEDCSDPSNPSDTPTGEIFDPLSNSWSTIDKPSPSFDFVRGDCNGAVLADGRVMLGAASLTTPPTEFRTAIWDPSDNTWIQAGLEFGTLATTDKSDPFEEEGWALLPDGSVLAPSVTNTPTAQRYVPSLDQWVDCANSPKNLAIVVLDGANVYEIGPAIALPTGGVLAIGGTGQTAVFNLGPNTTSAGSWTPGPAFPADTTAGHNWPTLTALDAPAAVMPSGKVVCLAGNAEPTDGDYFSSNPIVFEYDPSSSATTMPQLDKQPTFPSTNQTWQSTFLVLPTGQLLLSMQTNTLWLYTPDASETPNPAWKPANITVPGRMIVGHSYTLNGTQINGLTQCCSYGDDAGMATNYPIVRLTNPGTSEVVYLRSYDFSTMGIATGTTVPGDLESCTIDIPDGLATGAWNLQVIANGIASDPISIEIAAQDCYFILENSTFSVGEIETFVAATPPVNAVFDPAFYVVVEGFTAAEIGYGTPGLILPSVASPFPGHMTIAADGTVMAENPTLTTPQRFTFPFTITFLDDSMFGASGSTPTLTANFTAVGQQVSADAAITLTSNPNPYILHGDQTLTPPEPWYLSQDLRVFQVVAGGPDVFGVPIGTSGTASEIATTFIQAAVTNLRNNSPGSLTEFDNISQDEDATALQLAPNDPTTNQPVYNFAIARVRLRDTSPADNVRVFFRIWQAQQTNATYNTTTYPRATNGEGQPIPVLGVQGDEIITIPFFAEPRVSASEQLHTQTDDFNRHDIAVGTPETDYFFGCWLDINQPNDLLYPQRIVGVSADGPFDTVAPLFPIQQFMVAAHQCLIAEIAYDPDPITGPADPSTSDKLAQRNLAFVGAPNPGALASRRVPQTFEIKPTAPGLPAGTPPDELMIEWEQIPAQSSAEVFLPAVSAAEIVHAADLLYTSHLLEVKDPNTIRFPLGGVTYIPIPSGPGVTFAGLLTIDLPEGITDGDEYAAVVRQITTVRPQDIDEKDEQLAAEVAVARPRRTRQWRRTTGSFKLTIPVSTKARLLGPEESYFSIMESTAKAIPPSNRWYRVIERYLSQLAGRITFMGGDPGSIPATGTGILGSGRSRERTFVGKIIRLHYDRFGDFAGFTLETSGGKDRRFASREPNVGTIAMTAWEGRYRVRVRVEAPNLERPAWIEYEL